MDWALVGGLVKCEYVPGVGEGVFRVAPVLCPTKREGEVSCVLSAARLHRQLHRPAVLVRRRLLSANQPCRPAEPFSKTLLSAARTLPAYLADERSTLDTTRWTVKPGQPDTTTQISASRHPSPHPVTPCRRRGCRVWPVTGCPGPTVPLAVGRLPRVAMRTKVNVQRRLVPSTLDPEPR